MRGRPPLYIFARLNKWLLGWWMWRRRGSDRMHLYVSSLYGRCRRYAELCNLTILILRPSGDSDVLEGFGS